MNMTSKRFGTLAGVVLVVSAGVFGCELLVTFPTSEIADASADGSLGEAGVESSLADAKEDAANDAKGDSPHDAKGDSPHDAKGDSPKDVAHEDVIDAAEDVAPDTGGDSPEDSLSDAPSDGASE